MILKNHLTVSCRCDAPSTLNVYFNVYFLKNKILVCNHNIITKFKKVEC